VKKYPKRRKTRVSKVAQWIGNIPPFRWFRKKGTTPDRRVEQKTVKSTWQDRYPSTSQYVIDRMRHKRKKKLRARRNRKAARALHQMERRRA
jgi:hypothetical protein